MPQSDALPSAEAPSTAVGHLAVHLDARPEVPFLFEQQQKRLGGAFGASLLVHAGVFALLVLIASIAPKPQAAALIPDRLNKDIVWLNVPGPGGGGGGGGNRTPDPPRKAELPGKQKITVPVVKPIETPQPPKDEPKPEQQLTIPAKTLASGADPLPGVIEGPPMASASLGSGSGGGGGTGTGTGMGPGTGSGLGPGWGGGTGGGAYRPGNGVEQPRVLREVKPNYTAEAMRAKVQGIVLVECIVQPDGSVGSVQVLKSLDPTFGLDQEAVKAAKQWRFVPGTRFGQPVPVVVTIELTFTLR